MKKAWEVALVVSCLPLLAAATPPAEILKQVESSMRVKGHRNQSRWQREHGGHRQAGTNSRRTVDFVQKQILAWKFEPVLVGRKAMRVRRPMGVRVVARTLGEDSYSIAIRNASFEGEKSAEDETLALARLTPPRYLKAVAMSGASGVVYLRVKVGGEGRVVDAIVERVNLMPVGTTNEMPAWRGVTRWPMRR